MSPMEGLYYEMITLDLNHSYNKSSLYLSAMLNATEKEFQRQISKLDIINFYINDAEYNPSFSKAECLFLHLERSESLEDTLTAIKAWEYYADDYALGNEHMLVLSMYDFKDAFEAFKESKYSEMYPFGFIEEHFGTRARKKYGNKLRSEGINSRIIKEELNRQQIIYGVLTKDKDYRLKLSSALRARYNSIYGSPVNIPQDAELASLFDASKEIYRFGKLQDLSLVAHSDRNLTKTNLVNSNDLNNLNDSNNYYRVLY